MALREPIFPRGWVAFSLPGYRDHPGGRRTYSVFDYQALPPIGIPSKDNFDWLRMQPPKDDSLDTGKDGSPFAEQLARLSAQAGIAFPSTFTKFLSEAGLHQRIRSCTACYLLLPDYPVTVSGVGEGILIHFLSDQQWCYHWHLFVDGAGERGVVGSSQAFGCEPEDAPSPGGALPAIDLREDDALFCAPSFAEFVYRFWLENEIWFALHAEKRPLNPVERSYVEWYRRAAL